MNKISGNIELKKEQETKCKIGSYNIKNLVKIILFNKYSSNTMTTININNLLDKHLQ
jgi:hypothetical protein